jgi:hypothetical protein
MIMKRSLLALLLILGAVLCAHGQNSTPTDIVLLLDTSSGMSASYDNVNNYITGGFLSEFLRVGDTFHLITYSSRAKLDIARRVSSRGDIETIVGRMLIQYPIETGNDPASALSFAENYITTLPARPKKIVMVGTGGSNTNSAVSAAKQRLNARNVTLDFVQVTAGQPIANVPTSGRPADRRTTTGASAQSGGGGSGTGTAVAGGGAASGGTASGGGAGGVSQTQQGGSGSTSTRLDSSSSSGTGSTAGGGAGGTTGSGFGAADDFSSSSTGTTSQAGGGATGTTGAGGGTGTTDGTGGSGTDDWSTSTGGYSDGGGSQVGQLKTEKEPFDFSSSLPMIIGIIIGILLLLALIIFLASRKLGSSPNRVMAAVSTYKEDDDVPRVDHSNDLANYAASQSRQRSTPYADRPPPSSAYVKPVTINPTGPLLLDLFVEDQNRAIGKRNIHSLKSGYSLSVGGAKGDGFYIFLVPIPGNIGEVRRNGSSLTFTPRKPKYFPDGAHEVRDCLNKTIRIVSDKGYELRFRFEMWEDPLIALNRLLNSVKVPG